MKFLIVEVPSYPKGRFEYMAINIMFIKRIEYKISRKDAELGVRARIIMSDGTDYLTKEGFETILYRIEKTGEKNNATTN